MPRYNGLCIFTFLFSFLLPLNDPKTFCMNDNLVLKFNL